MKLNFFTDMKISQKLIVGFALLILLTGGTGFVGYWGMQQINVAQEVADHANTIIEYTLSAQSVAIDYTQLEDVKYEQEVLDLIRAIEAEVEAAAEINQIAVLDRTFEDLQAEVTAFRKEVEGYEAVLEVNKEIRASLTEYTEKLEGAVGEIEASQGISEAAKIKALEVEAAFQTAELAMYMYMNDGSTEKWSALTPTLTTLRASASSLKQISAGNQELARLADTINSAATAFSNEASTLKTSSKQKETTEAAILEASLQILGSSETGSKYRGGAKLADSMATAQVKAIQAQSDMLILGTVAVSAVVGVALTLLITRSITSPITALIQDAKVIAGGELQHKIQVEDRKDEIGDIITAVKEMVRNTAEPLGELGAISKKIAAGDFSQEINVEARGDVKEFVDSFKSAVSYTKELVRTATSASTVIYENGRSVVEAARSVGDMGTQMAQEAEKLSTSMQQVQGATQNVSDGAQNLSKISQDSAKVVDEVMQLMSQVNDFTVQMNQLVKSSNELTLKVGEGSQNALVTLNEIKDSSGKVQEVIREVQTSVTNVAGLANDISEIAGQVNMLALNAAIEAARAGEAGRGFAVVADAVKQLAGQTGTAAKNAVETIGEITKAGDRAAEIAQSSGEAAVKGDRVVSESVGGTANVVKAMNEITDITGKLVLGVEKTLSQLENVNSAIQQVASFSEESAAAAEESSASVEQQTASTEEVSAGAIRVQEESKKTLELSERILKEVESLRAVLDRVKI